MDRSGHAVLAVFDFDGTLISGDSFILFAIHAKGKAGFMRSLIRTSPYLVAWKLGLCSAGKAKEKLFRALFKGMRIVDFKSYSRTFADVLENYVNRDVLEAMLKHKASGHCVMILSASVPEWIRPWAGRHGVTEVYGTGMEIDGNGKLTGKFSTPNCRGKEKVCRLLELKPARHTYSLWSYADSKSDYPLLKVSDHCFRIQNGHIARKSI